MSVCRECGEQITWYTDSDGRHVPLHNSGSCSGRSENSTSPAAFYVRCERCGQRTWFVRHNGGSFWVDELGPPWPKHPCYDGPVFRSKTHFTVGKRQWQPCDFCNYIGPLELYAAHLRTSHRGSDAGPRDERKISNPTMSAGSLNGPLDTRVQCDCGGKATCVMCEGSGWFIEHYDGDFTPGKKG